MQKINLRTRGIIFILSSPSSCGKSTLTKSLIQNDSQLSHPASFTTRAPRNSEVNGIDYTFVNKDQFNKMLDNGDFLETTNIYGNFYGTHKSTIENAINLGKDLILNIDWHGAANLYTALPKDTVRIFLLPPNLKSLRERINARGQDKPNEIDVRMNAVIDDVKNSLDYDYIVINNEFPVALEEIKCIFTAERLKRSRLTKLEDFLQYA